MSERGVQKYGGSACGIYTEYLTISINTRQLTLKYTSFFGSMSYKIDNFIVSSYLESSNDNYCLSGTHTIVNGH